MRIKRYVETKMVATLPKIRLFKWQLLFTDS
jgi:hypothetical protein